MAKATLHTPIKRGKDEITDIELREPTAGELRGIKMMDIIQMDAAAFADLLPRISTPVLTKDEFNALSMSNLAAIQIAVVGMLEGKPSETQ